MAAFSSASEKNWRLRKRRQDPAFGDLHANFRGGLIPRSIRSGGQNRHGVRARPLQVAGVQLGLVPARNGHPDFRLSGFCGRPDYVAEGGRGRPKAALQSGNPWRQPESGHITQPS